MFSRYSKRSSKIKEKNVLKKVKETEARISKVKKKKLVCKGKFETWTEFLTFRLFLNV